MKIQLIKTPEYAQNDYEEVTELLKSFEGPLKFISTAYEFNRKDFYFLGYDLYPNHRFKYPDNKTLVEFDPRRGFPLSWYELFRLCDFYRDLFKVGADDFVVLLTQRKNALNWFSAFNDKKNVLCIQLNGKILQEM